MKFIDSSTNKSYTYFTQPQYFIRCYKKKKNLL